MKIRVLSLFPETIENFANTGLMGRAKNKGLIEIETLNPRAVTTDTHHTVDDKVYGGGDGMLMKADILQASLCQAQSLGFESARVIYLSPQGRKLDDPFL